MRTRLLAFVLGVLLGSPALSQAQVAQRSMIRGGVTDRSGAALSRASVVLSGTHLLGGTRVEETDTGGRYAFAGLLPGTYDITVTAAGMQTSRRSGVDLPVETTYDVNFSLDIQRVAESVEVRAERPLIDIRRTSSPILFSQSMLHDLPTARSLSAILSLAPGVTTPPPYYGVTGEVAFGGTHASNGFSVDGVTLNEPTLGQSWSQINYNWLQEVQVIGLGASAEHGGFTGAVANGVLRSGSNRMAGLAEWLVTRPNWSSENLDGFPANETKPVEPRTILTWWDLNGQLGAPIKRDRVWLFTGVSTFDHQYREFGYQGPGRTTQRTNRLLVKLDAAATQDLALQGFVTADRDTAIGVGLSRFTPSPESVPDVYRRSTVWNLRSNWTARPSWLVEVRGRGNRADSTREPHPPAHRSGPAPTYVVEEQAYCCNTTWSTHQGRTSIVSVAVGWAGHGPAASSHDVRAGVEREHAPGGSEYGYPTGRSLAVRGGEIVGMTEWAGSRLRSTTDRVTAFVQDRWILGSRLTLEPGLRVDWNSGSLPMRKAAVTTTAIAPRFGVAWDITGRQGTVFRLHLGRYHDPLFGHVYEGLEPDAVSPYVSYSRTEQGLVEAARVSAAVHAVVANELKQPHVDQGVVSLEQSLGRDVTMEVRYMGRRFGNFIGYVDRQLSAWSEHRLADPGPDGVRGTADDGGLMTLYRPYGSDFDSSGRDLMLGNPASAHRHYHALQLVATRRMTSRWQAQVSYTLSRSSGTVNNEYHTNATYWSLSPLGSVGSNKNVAALPAGQPKYDYSEFKAIGSYRPSWLGGFTTGVAFRWHNGVRWQRTVTMQDPFFLSFAAEPLGSRRAPSLGSLDVRLEKQVDVTRVGRLGLYLDVFNATNVGRPTDYVSNSGRDFGRVSGWTDPRTARLGLRLAF